MIGYKSLDPAMTFVPHILSLSNEKPPYSSIQRGYFIPIATGQKRTATLYQPPSLELYTMFSPQVYFFVFWGILITQNLVIYFVNKIWLKNIPQSATKWDRITHAIGNSHVPFPFTNWHDGDGNCQEHIDRHRSSQTEVLVTTLVNLVFNMILLFPLGILCNAI